MGVKFEAGKTYWARSVCDYDSIFSITVEKRIGKCTILTKDGKKLRCVVKDGFEQVKPMGNYSMCPIITSKNSGPMPGEKSLVETLAESEALFTESGFDEMKAVCSNVVNLADYKKKKLHQNG